VSGRFGRSPAAVGAADVERCAAVVAAAAGSVFAALEQLAARFGDEWTASVARKGSYDSSDLARLQTDVFEALDDQPAFDSAGYVLCEGTLADRTRHLDWWHRTSSGDYEFLLLNLDPEAPDCYDYYSMEWFAAALDDRRRFVSGPLIDLPCADVYILTFTTPIIAGPTLLGVAGADVAVARFESRIVPALRELPIEAVLVNRERRVIASNDARFTTGEKLPSMPGSDGSWHSVVPVTDDLGWLLAAGHTGS
jgi:hypothetical protein